jgi:hypothetical protein
MGSIRTILIGSLLASGAAIKSEDVEGYLYSRAGVAVMQQVSQPAPAPAPSGKCETCNGTGKVGDGRVFTDCLDCGGDGIASVGSPISFVAVQDVCEDGSCTLLPVGVEGGEVPVVAAGGLASRVLGGDGPVRKLIRKRPVRSLVGRIFCR